MKRTFLRLGVGCVLVLSACAEDPASEPFDPEPLKNAETPDCDTLESKRLDGIGLLSVDGSQCTATLLAPNVILTAAHCFDFTTKTPEQAAGHAKFEIDPWNVCGRHQEVSLRRWISFSTSDSDGHDIDLAVALLDESIPATGSVKHYSIATAYPASGSQVTMYGRGYTGDGWQDLWWGDRLRYATVTYDFNTPGGEWIFRTVRESEAGTSYLDHGDSGGPVIGENGQIFALNVAILGNQNGKDLEYFGDAVELNRRTALPFIVSAFSAGLDWPTGSASDWACAAGKSSFCDTDYPGYLRQCSGTNDLFAAHRKYCPAGCLDDACAPHACQGKDFTACSDDPSCIWSFATCDGTSYSECLPQNLTEDQVCATLSGEKFGSAPTTGGQTSSGGDCCAGDNMCANPPNTAGCAMTAPGGYCDPNGDGSYTDGDWVKGYEAHQSQCGGAPTTPPSPGNSCPCSGDNRCANPPSTPGCPMTSPGGYCDPNGDGSYTDGDWVKGWTEHQSDCG